MDNTNITSIILNYVNDLRSRETAVEEKYDREISTIRKLQISNNTFSSVAVATGTGGIATGLTVIGLPVTVGLGSIAVLCSTVSFVLTGVSGKFTKRALVYKNQLKDLREARIELERILAFAIKDGGFKSLEDSEIQNAISIYQNVLKKNKIPPLVSGQTQ